jgi:hypothetical protein
VAEQPSSAAPAARAQMMQDYAKQIVNQNSPGKYSKKS